MNAKKPISMKIKTFIILVAVIGFMLVFLTYRYVSSPEYAVLLFLKYADANDFAHLKTLIVDERQSYYNDPGIDINITLVEIIKTEQIDEDEFLIVVNVSVERYSPPQLVPFRLKKTIDGWKIFSTGEPVGHLNTHQTFTGGMGPAEN